MGVRSYQLQKSTDETYDADNETKYQTKPQQQKFFSLAYDSITTTRWSSLDPDLNQIVQY